MTKEEATKRAEEILKNSKSNLDIVGRLTQTLRTNSAFHNSLDAQVQAIIEREQTVEKEFAELEVIMKEHFSILVPAPAPAKKEASPAVVGPGAVTSEKSKETK